MIGERGGRNIRGEGDNAVPNVIRKRGLVVKSQKRETRKETQDKT
jgi:hypothetical protein